MGSRPVRSAPFIPDQRTPLMTGLAILAGRRETADSLLGSLAVNGFAFRAATGWQPPVTPEAAFDDVAKWYKTVGRTNAA